MRCKKEKFYMNGHDVSNRAVLFLRAYWDVWTAERIWFGDPNNAVWQCVLAVEKTLKGFCECNGIYEHAGNTRDFNHEMKRRTIFSRERCDSRSL